MTSSHYLGTKLSSVTRGITDVNAQSSDGEHRVVETVTSDGFGLYPVVGECFVNEFMDGEGKGGTI